MPHMEHETERVTAAIAAELRAARARRGMTRDELAERAGVSRSAVFRIERGERVVRMDQLFQLAAALDADPADILQQAQIQLRRQAERGE